MKQTPEQYYDPLQDNTGNYQFMKLSELISGFELDTHDPQNYLYGLGRSIITKHAKAAVRTLSRTTAKDIKGLELTIGDDLTFHLPQDYVDYVRISVVSENNILAPLDINTNLNTAISYLQDHDYKILFDDEGDVIKADGNNLTNKPYRSFTFQEPTNQGGRFQLDTSVLSRNGEFVIDQRAGVIYFGSSLQGKDVVLEYISDGVDWERIHETEITYHKLLDDAMKDLVYFNCIERRTNVPANEKQRADLKFKASEHQAAIKLANFDVRAIERVWRKGSVWVK
jgi:hypothetical protein